MYRGDSQLTQFVEAFEGAISPSGHGSHIEVGLSVLMNLPGSQAVQLGEGEGGGSEAAHIMTIGHSLVAAVCRPARLAAFADCS